MTVKRITNGELKTFKQCRRKWYLGWYRRLRPGSEKILGAAALGTRVHLCLQTWYSATPGDPFKTLAETVARDAELIGDDWERQAELGKEVELARIMLEGYFDWLEETGADQGLTIVGVEERVQVPFVKEPYGVWESVDLLGKLDLRLRREWDNTRLFLDHKTVGSIPDASSRLHMDEQMLHYSLIETLKWRHDREQRRLGATPLESPVGFPGVQPSTAVDMHPLRETDSASGGEGTGQVSGSSHERVEGQQPEASESDASRMSLELPQQGEAAAEVGSAQSGAQQGGQEPQARTSVDRSAEEAYEQEDDPSLEGPEGIGVRTVGALYNMLRKVKRTAKANPPFYGRVEVRHNVHELRSYYARVWATVADIAKLEHDLGQGYDHRAVAYPNPTRDCSWRCEFFNVCTMFDDGSDAEGMLKAFYHEADPLDRYQEDEINRTD